MQAVLMAVWQRPDRTPVILHSDRGGQFTSDEYQAFLAAHAITCSMSAVGSCADNAAAESFFGRLKRERVNRRQYRTRAEARADVFDYIERGHNPRQRRRLAFRQEGDKLLTQPSVKTGENPGSLKRSKLQVFSELWYRPLIADEHIPSLLTTTKSGLLAPLSCA
jgi:putative transposase